MSTVLLQIDSLSLVTDAGPITKDFSFQIKAGEILALTGKSGSGKTSVAMAILGLLSPGIRQTSGQITLSLNDNTFSLPKDAMIWPSMRGTHIGFTQQDVYGAFDPVIKMGKQMMMVVIERKKNIADDVEKAIREKMEEVGLQDIERIWNSYPHQLSGGQLQRCQICMAIAIQPELLIADEPTSAIDKINQTELLDVFAALRKKYNMAILCITHDATVVSYLADREINMKDDADRTAIQTNRNVPKDVNGAEPILIAEKLTYHYQYGGLLSKKGATVGPLDFSLKAGMCMGIIGESGSGKSTIAQLLVGLLSPFSGKLILEGKEIDFKKPKDIRWMRSRIQLVMQDGRGSLHPDFTIRRLLNEVLATPGKDTIHTETEILSVLQNVDLPAQILDRKPGTLSGGECLRVSIARALLLNPKILVCDESTSALDTKNKHGILILLQNLIKARKMSVIFISHDEQLIRDMADWILVMADGQLVEQGLATELFESSVHPVTQKIFSGAATISRTKPL